MFQYTFLVILVYPEYFLHVNTTKTVEEKFKNIQSIAKEQEPLRITQEDITSTIKQLKKKKAADHLGWKNEMIIEGGEQMEISLGRIYNKIMEEGETPEEWEKMVIKSIYKNKGQKLEMTNRRGIFLTNIISKLFEKVINNKTKNEIKMSEYQSGGQTRRSTVDNWIVLGAVIDNNKRIGKETYIIFVDAEKCFDKLWLKDTLVDLHEAGLRERETNIIYEMNKMSTIFIKTPVGETKPIIANEIVKQGTIYGPKLCCVSTDKINTLEEECITYLSPDLYTKGLVFVDDMAMAGSREAIEKFGKNIKSMEEKKKFTISVKKSNYMIITNNENKTMEEVHIEVEKGIIQQTKEYKYLGNWINSKGNMDRHLEESEGKIKGMVAEVKRTGNKNKVGVLDLQIQLLLFEKTIMSTILFNLEAWTGIRAKDITRLERMQTNGLKNILGVPRTTPELGIQIETGTWPMINKIHYKKLMLLRELMTSDENRLAKESDTATKRT